MDGTAPAQRARIAVIGKGLMGSAAARHLARQSEVYYAESAACAGRLLHPP